MIMEPADWYIEGCLSATPEEVKQFNEWTAHLPKREESTPYHSGAHSIKHFRHAFAIAELKRPTVLEVGFCLGHSAEIMLRLGASHVTSIEISDRPQTIEAISIMGKKWNGRHWTFHPDQAKERVGKYDFAFIDGDHSEAAISRDIDLALSASVEWILFDDWYPKWGDTQEAMRKKNMCPVAVLGTMALWGK